MKFDVMVVILFMVVGMCLGVICFMKFCVNFEVVVVKNMIIGFMWGVGNVFMLLVVVKVGLVIVFSFF